METAKLLKKLLIAKAEDAAFSAGSLADLLYFSAASRKMYNLRVNGGSHAR